MSAIKFNDKITIWHVGFSPGVIFYYPTLNPRVYKNYICIYKYKYNYQSYSRYKHYKLKQKFPKSNF